LKSATADWQNADRDNTGLRQTIDALEPVTNASRDLIKQADLLVKLGNRLIDTLETNCNAAASDHWHKRGINRVRKAADSARAAAVEQLKQVRYFWRQAHWLSQRFPDAELRDVEGLVKLVDHAELEANDWS